MTALLVPMPRPGAKVRPRGGNEWYGCMAGRGAWQGKAESESWGNKKQKLNNAASTIDTTRADELLLTMWIGKYDSVSSMLP